MAKNGKYDDKADRGAEGGGGAFMIKCFQTLGQLDRIPAIRLA